MPQNPRLMPATAVLLTKSLRLLMVDVILEKKCYGWILVMYPVESGKLYPIPLKSGLFRCHSVDLW